MDIIRALDEIEKAEDAAILITRKILKLLYKHEPSNLYCEDMKHEGSYDPESNDNVIFCIMRYAYGYGEYDSIGIDIPTYAINKPDEGNILYLINKYKKKLEIEKKQKKEEAKKAKKIKEKEKHKKRKELYEELKKEFD